MHPPQLPESLESIQKAEYFSIQRHRWNTNEEIASILISFDKHEEWLSKEVKIRPKSGSMMLYSRKRVRYRRDGYCWKKRKDGKTTREDHMKLKVQGTECIYGCYVHSAILPTFHRRCYWLLQNPDIVLVHYLNVPYTDDNKIISPTLNYFADSKKEWTKEELISELKPMFFSESEPDLNNELELSTAETIEAIVQQLMAKQRAKVKAIEDASDIGINARALTVVAAVTTNAKEKQHSQRESHTKLTNPIPVAVKPASPKNHLLKRDVTATCIIAAPTAGSGPRTVGNPGSVQLVQIGNTPSSTAPAKSATGQLTGHSPGNQAPASLIFNLSQFQNGSGLLILNSATSSTHTCTSNAANSDSDAINAPVTLLYSRTNSSNNPITVSSTSAKPSGPIVSTIPVQVKPITTHKLQNLNTKIPSEIKQERQIGDTSNSNTEEASDIVQPALVATSMDIINGNCNTPQNGDVSILKPILENSSASSTSNSENQISEEAEVIISSSTVTKNSNLQQLHCNADNGITTLQPNLEDHYYQNVTNPSLQNCRSNYSNGNEAVDLNPMDFIDNDISTPDEELFNLDAFDMLTEFPNLDDLNNLNSSPLRSNLPSNSVLGFNVGKALDGCPSHTANQPDAHYREGMVQIIDYSPEWSYPEGGIKVLVIGPWFSSSLQYSVLFNGVSVETSLVQSGVLRCYCPSHEPGFVTLQVACQGCIVSNSAIFEYKDRAADDAKEKEDCFMVDDNAVKFCLLERLEILESRVSFNLLKDTKSKSFGNLKYTVSFEDQMVSFCEQMMCSPWLPCDDSSLTSKSLRSGSSLTDMSLLHLTAALGYCKLTQCLLKWKNDNPSIILEMEVDAFSCDRNECTPLMWSIAKGHKETALILYQWNKAAINLCDNQGCSPLHVARKKGFTELVDEIQRLEDVRHMETDLDCESPKHKCCKTTKRDSGCLTHFHHECFYKSLSVDGIYPPKGSSHFKVNHTMLNHQMESEREPNSSGGASFSSQRSSLASSCDISNDDGLLSMDSNGESSRVLTIAEHIIAAMPDRIKAAVKASLSEAEYEDFEPMLSDNHQNSSIDNMHCTKTGTFSFEFSDYSYRHREAGTPTSSPASSCLQSPSSFNNLDSPSPPPTAADFCEFFQASGKIVEKEFSNLTLSDFEQRELYEAARTIQKAYRIYKGRKRQEQEHEKEKQAAILIQSYYRRYKQYIYYKQMTKAAQVIQTQFRNYCENKRFKKSLNQDMYITYGVPQNCNNVVNTSMTAINMRNPFYSMVPEADRKQSVTRESGSLKRTYSQRRQNQAAKKIQQFLRQSKNKLQRERALAAKDEKCQQDQKSVQPAELQQLKPSEPSNRESQR